MIVLAAIVAVTSVIFLVALKQPSNRAPLLTTPSTHTTPSTGNGLTTDTGSTQKAETHATHKAAHKQFTVTLTASERCWVAITTAPSGGNPVMSTHGTDLSGYPIDPAVDATVTFKSKAPVYMSVGAPGSLQVSINGKVDAAALRCGRRNPDPRLPHRPVTGLTESTGPPNRCDPAHRQ